MAITINIIIITTTTAAVISKIMENWSVWINFAQNYFTYLIIIIIRWIFAG